MRTLIAAVLALGALSCRAASEPATTNSTGPGADDSASTATPTSGTTEAVADTTAADTTSPGDFSLRFEEIAVQDGLALTSEFRFIPGTMEFLALSKPGQVDHYRIDGDTAEHLGGFVLPDVYSELDCGLLSLAFDPDFSRNRLIYIGACRSETDSAITRLTYDADDSAATVASRTDILVVGDPAAPKPWHNVGQIGFDTGGNLWALFGDKRVSANGQDQGNDLSALVRIVPNREPDGSGHTPADGNPFADVRGASPNVVAIGLRSPWRGVYDSLGRYWFGDVGANGFEEINIVADPGTNFGWPVYEGPCDGDAQACEGFVDPIIAWAHEGTHPYQIDDPEVSPTNARVAWVGLEYTASYGDQYDGELTGQVLFGDYCQGFVRAAAVNAAGSLTADRPVGHLRLPTAWNEGADGFIYVSTFGKCETANLDESDPPPSKLFRAVRD